MGSLILSQGTQHIDVALTVLLGQYPMNLQRKVKTATEKAQDLQQTPGRKERLLRYLAKSLLKASHRRLI